ncbi:MAG: hypothetical protein ACQETH_07660 [Candidatus Rifleibacteriota bacterium]
MNNRLAKKSSGSIFIVVLGAIALLGIISFTIIQTNSSRSFTTRFMSNEQKVEAVLESASDLMLGYIKNQMNQKDSDFYHFFRIPGSFQGSQLSHSEGKNLKIDVSQFKEITDLNEGYEGLKPLESLIENLGEDNVDLTMNVKIIQAEAFTSDIDDYEVVGVTHHAHEPRGESAKFLHSIDRSAETDGSLSSSDWAPSDWRVDFKLPSLEDEDIKNFSVDVNISVFGVSVTVSVKVRITITRVAAAVAHARVDVISPVSMPNVYSEVFDFNKILEESFIDLDGEPISIPGIRRFAMPDSDTSVFSISYQAQRIKNEIDDEYDDLCDKIDEEQVEPDGFGSDAKVVEKGGILEITGLIDYYPHGKDHEDKITRKLVSTLPFKVSDIQPIAPEYSFFVAASDKIDEDLSSLTGGKVNFDSSAGGVFMVHSVPEGNFNFVDGFNFNSSEDDFQRIPGMIRINAPDVIDLHTFVGTPDEPYLTEFNVMTSPKNNSQFMNIPVFQWKSDPGTRDHEVDFPVLFDPAPDMNPIIPVGLEGVELFFKQGGLALNKTPSLLYGKCHMEYPLGICMEGPVNMVYSNALIKVKPSAEVDLDEVDTSSPPPDVNLASMSEAFESGDIGTYSELINDASVEEGEDGVTENSQIFVDYQNINTLPYGMLNYTSYSDPDEWDPARTDNLPANCYSLLQYAKKSTYFYETAQDFIDNHPRHPDDTDAYDINGVIYIKDTLTVESSLKVMGKGQIVCKNDIILDADVKHGDNESVLSLIARGGAIYFSGCSEIEAACYSNLAPVCNSSSMVKLTGNLVANEFDRDQILNLEIFYDTKKCTASYLSLIRDVGKFAPERYWVSLAKNWSTYKYEKL